ncbi:MAG TPA: hypothetical protein VK867_04730 [Candidatus Limnocylindrales bacterium]|nr:hypothetical protein [Candidatus Limnocylindrales bacterium]
MADSLSHARHDRFAIAAAIGGAKAPSTVATCPQCGALHRDLLSIRTALRHAWTPKRPRDLRIDTTALARLRPALWRRLLGAIGSSRDTITRPLAAGLTTIGFAGLVLVSAGPMLVGVAGEAAPPEVTMHAVDGPPGSAIDRKFGDESAPTDPMLMVSGGSLAAGGTVLALRRIAVRVRRVR